MADLIIEPYKKIYWDRQTYGSFDEHLKAMRIATTIYIGNLSFFTTEWQLHETFSTVGDITRIVMGLDRFKKTPCGFSFIEFEHPESARLATQVSN